MALHIYIKQRETVAQNVLHTVSYLFVVGGFILLFWSLYPVLSYQLQQHFTIGGTEYSPLTTEHANSLAKTKLTASVLGTFDTQRDSKLLRDVVQANQWFPGAVTYIQDTQVLENTASSDVLVGNKTFALSDIKNYTLTIPKLQLFDILVTVGGEALDTSLVHYLPLSLPGTAGTVAIFGHSSLPQLYHSTDFKTIFTYLPSLEKGDRFLIRIQDQTYEYEVAELFVVKPDQVSVLTPQYDNSYVLLITCVPPGTWWNRLVVKAKLVKK